MRYATVSAASYCGIDLHARTMYLVVLDAQGNTRLGKNLPANPEAFLSAIAPFLPDVVVARECVHTWLKWAFSEAAVLSAQKDERIGRYLQKLKSRYAPGQALGALAHKLGRAVYHMLRHGRVFDAERFLRH